jgi:hypothetical protein
MKTKILSLLFALAGICAQAQVNYAVSGNTAYVTDSPSASGDIVITNIYNGYPVTSIGDDAFEDCPFLTSVTIPNSVTSIGYDAFYDCSTLTSVTIGNSVTSIGAGAFEACYLTSVTIPDSVTSVGVGAFACYRLTNIAVGASNPDYSSVNGVLFDKARTSLIEFPGGLVGSYAISNNVTSIGDGAFYFCYRLTSVTIPNSVTNIGDGAFQYCFGLTSVTIGNSVTSIGDGAFYECYDLTSVAIPDSVTSIGGYVFENCTSLTSVTIPDSVTSIGDEAFYSCSSLTSVTIPNSVTNIGDYAFVDCSSLTSITFLGNAPLVEGAAGSADSTVFQGESGTVYYLPGTTGWGSTFGGWPTALWYQPQPQILGSGLGVQGNQFGFTISWATNLSVVVQAATNLSNPIWIPVATNTLVNGTNAFTDPTWTNYPQRFYRVKSLP